MTSCENCSCEIEDVFEVKFVFETREGMNKFMKLFTIFSEKEMIKNKRLNEEKMIRDKVKQFQKQFDIKTFNEAKYEYVEHLKKINKVLSE